MMMYVYIQLMVTYLTFRTKYCDQTHMNLLYRIHVFNFLYSLFLLATGYVQLMSSLVSTQSTANLNLPLMIFELVSLVLAHIVVMVYLCCPKVSLSEEMM